jgi:hypothetical protein
MNACRAALATWWKLIQAVADPRLNPEVRAESVPLAEWPQQMVAGSMTTLSLSQLGLLEDGPDMALPDPDLVKS